MAPICSELWNHYSIPEVVDLDCLLPNGFLITIQCARETTLKQVKIKIWEETKKFNVDMISTINLQHIDNYVFVSVSQEAKVTEYYDNEKRICDLKLFYAVFKLVEAQGDLVEKSFNSNLTKTIGLCLNEIEQNKNLEVIQFRFELLQILAKHQNQLINSHQECKSLIDNVYAPNLEIDPSLLEVSISNATVLPDGISFLNPNINSTKCIDINVHVMETDQLEQTFRLNVPLTYNPTDIVIDVIKSKLFLSKLNQKEVEDVVQMFKSSYALNVCGCDEIFYGDSFKIGSYKYIQHCVANDKKPNFHLISIEKLKSKLPIEDNFLINLIEKYIKNQQVELNEINQIKQNSNKELSWNSNEIFSIYLDNLTYLPYLKDGEKLFFKFAIYHGQDLITNNNIESEKFELEKLGKDSSMKLNQNLSLGINIKNLHRSARLCISLYCIPKKKREFFSIGWLSMNLFDFRGYLINGKIKLYLWQSTHNTSFSHDCLSDVSGQNPNKDYIRLNVEFLKTTEKDIVYPSKEEIKEMINHTPSITQDDCFDVAYALENDNSLLESILNKDSLAELTEQEKNVLWRRREDCLNYPHSLPKLLQTVKWSNQNEVIEIYNLLYKWPEIKPIVAIELLHSTYSDLQVRSFAVNCLEKNMKDEEVHIYLLQLVQTLKNEPYYDNLLTRFLLNKALKSQRIGFELFWSLKSEMKNSRYKLRFGLILEAYCLGIGSLQLKILLKQVEVVEKLSNLAREIKANSNNISLITSSFLHDVLKKSDYFDTLSNLICPLNRSHLLGTIEPTRCRILSSAKRPLYLTWKNLTDYASLYRESFNLIFKLGDDLRQDKLSLQILKLMDLIWKNEGIDLKMIVYSCFSTGYKTGFIEVINDAMTLFKIQMEGGIRCRYQIDTSQLFRWISLNNQDDKLDNAIDLFTRSCAGFCVATFILGIGDRHPDNIMINKDGRLFHIDFGHFLGNFKKKYGIKRERTPFVLTEDFAKVITKGSSNPFETVEFKNFQSLCESAYMIIRRYSHLIINLFTLMLSSDMPELQSIEDIMFLRKTLAIDDTDEKALEFFREQFNESYKYSYTTKLDWLAHALNRKNLI